MSQERKSKRHERRAKMHQRERRNRLIMIGLITLGAALLVFAVVWPQLKPIAGIITVTPNPRPNEDRNSMGDPNAPIKIEQFADFQCPYCKQFFENTEPLLVQYFISTGKVQFTYRSAGNFVSGNVGTGNTESQDAALAAYCAADQGKFWEMHDALFANNRDVENQGSFVSRRLTAIARSVGLDMPAWQNCYNSGKYKDQVQQDFDDFSKAVTDPTKFGTPYFVITYKVNGETKTETLEGAQPFDAFQQKIEAALNEIGTD
jgi:protein-disulfide isomerase